jgi:hypothetical protein
VFKNNLDGKKGETMVSVQALFYREKTKAVSWSLTHGFMAFLIIMLVLFLASASGCSSEPEPVTKPITFLSPTPLSTEDMSKLTAGVQLASKEPDSDGVELESVGLAKEVSLIVVSFKGSVKTIANWQQGSVYLIDESTNVSYRETAVLPLMGPMIARPREEGQSGYVMLSNPGSAIKSGSVVTVVLGSYKRLHVTVE